MKLIINADDFGRNAIANERIAQCFRKDVISTSTIMANMPGFKEAVDIIINEGYQSRIGIHAVLDEGKPITEKMQKCRKFCDENGNYKNNIPRHQYLNKMEREIVSSEILAQIKRIKDVGISISHLDSHRHRHQDIWIAIAIKKALIKSNIPYIRRHKTKDKLLRRLYGWLVERIYIFNSNIQMVDKLYSVYDEVRFVENSNCVVEIMCHPEIDYDFNLLMNEMKIENGIFSRIYNDELGR